MQNLLSLMKESRLELMAREQNAQKSIYGYNFSIMAFSAMLVALSNGNEWYERWLHFFGNDELQKMAQEAYNNFLKEV